MKTEILVRIEYEVDPRYYTDNEELIKKLTPAKISEIDASTITSKLDLVDFLSCYHESQILDVHAYPVVEDTSLNIVP